MTQAKRILVGTASWTDPSMVKHGNFYPKGCNTAEARLRFYASQFPIVEVDSTYYALPAVKNSQAWVERTPDEFVFNVKAFRLFTGHQTPDQGFPADIKLLLKPHFDKEKEIYYRDLSPELRTELWTRFEAGIRPLREAGKLGVVHFQFAPWVKPAPRVFEHIEDCAKRLAGYTLAIEFRNTIWFDDEHRDATLAFARNHNFVHVIADTPQGFSNSALAIWKVTNPALAILRLHGRNTTHWGTPGATVEERFDYMYSDEELEEIATHLEHLTAFEIHVLFNNTHRDQGHRNATTLLQMLRARGATTSQP
jgi:uncharacterized protein YecE (DUF72 family)